MHRGYTAERYLTRLAPARAAIPDLAVTTDLIVGFPGETDADFERTLEVVEIAEYDAAYTFVFSPRPGTEAATMHDDFIDPMVTKERMQRLTTAVERHALVKHGARLGRDEEVLIDGPSKNGTAMCSRVAPGSNKLVHFDGGPVPPEAGGFRDRPHHVRGTALASR